MPIWIATHKVIYIACAVFMFHEAPDKASGGWWHHNAHDEVNNALGSRRSNNETKCWIVDCKIHDESNVGA